MHLLLVDAPNRAISMDEMFHAGLQPLRAFVSLYPMDGILRASEKCGRPIHRILSDTTSNSQINLDCATGSTVAYNTTHVFE